MASLSPTGRYPRSPCRQGPPATATPHLQHSKHTSPPSPGRGAAPPRVQRDSVFLPAAQTRSNAPTPPGKTLPHRKAVSSRTRSRVTRLAPPPPCAPASGSWGRVSSDQKRPAAQSLVSSSPVTPGGGLGPHALGQSAAAFVLRLGRPFLPLWQAVVSGARLQLLRPLPLRWGRLSGRTRQ